MLPKTAARNAITAYLVVACLTFLLLMCAVCMIICPQLFDHPHWGLSFYGSQRTVFLPYYGGYAIVIFCLAQVTRRLWSLQNRWRPLKVVFLVATILTTLMAATSYMQGAFLFWSHIYICLVLLLWLFGSEAWILSRRGNTWVEYVSVALLLAGAIIVNLSSTWVRGGVLGLYAWGEVVFFVGALTCLGQAARRAVSE